MNVGINHFGQFVGITAECTRPRSLLHLFGNWAVFVFIAQIYTVPRIASPGWISWAHAARALSRGKTAKINSNWALILHSHTHAHARRVDGYERPCSPAGCVRSYKWVLCVRVRAIAGDDAKRINQSCQLSSWPFHSAFGRLRRGHCQFSVAVARHCRSPPTLTRPGSNAFTSPHTIAFNTHFDRFRFPTTHLSSADSKQFSNAFEYSRIRAPRNAAFGVSNHVVRIASDFNSKMKMNWKLCSCTK